MVLIGLRNCQFPLNTLEISHLLQTNPLVGQTLVNTYIYIMWLCWKYVCSHILLITDTWPNCCPTSIIIAEAEVKDAKLKTTHVQRCPRCIYCTCKVVGRRNPMKHSSKHSQQQRADRLLYPKRMGGTGSLPNGSIRRDRGPLEHSPVSLREFHRSHGLRRQPRHSLPCPVHLSAWLSNHGCALTPGCHATWGCVFPTALSPAISEANAIMGQRGTNLTSH